MRAEEFGYELPSELIAQYPEKERDGSRLLHLERRTGGIRHLVFRDVLEEMKAGDVLVLNNSRVISARIRGRKAGTGAKVEFLLLEKVDGMTWWSMVRPGKRFPSGSRVEILNTRGEASGLEAEVGDKNEEGHALIRFRDPEGTFSGSAGGGRELLDILEDNPIGETPLPPYIDRTWDSEEDPEVYQTVYAAERGSVAAPTAGLHWTRDLLGKVKQKGVELAEVTLHVGAGTFAPVKVDNVKDHTMHKERFEISGESADRLNRAMKEGRRIIAVGTTSLRVLESAVLDGPEGDFFKPGESETRLFVYPPCQFRVVGALITNFHLPQSTLMMLVSAFASPGSMEGVGTIRACYQEAINKRYRFFSYGDAMLIT